LGWKGKEEGDLDEGFQFEFGSGTKRGARFGRLGVNGLEGEELFCCC
jgi:hypothetical protein